MNDPICMTNPADPRFVLIAVTDGKSFSHTYARTPDRCTAPLLWRSIYEWERRMPKWPLYSWRFYKFGRQWGERCDMPHQAVWDPNWCGEAPRKCKMHRFRKQACRLEKGGAA